MVPAARQDQGSRFRMVHGWSRYPLPPETYTLNSIQFNSIQNFIVQLKIFLSGNFSFAALE
jgi:hypothetical protein